MKPARGWKAAPTTKKLNDRPYRYYWDIKGESYKRIHLNLDFRAVFYPLRHAPCTMPFALSSPKKIRRVAG
jgi:hypothetical protein